MSADTTRTVGGAPARQRRAEIQGLRTLAAGLVGAYHIWFDRVSGGVDVFFVVSGFLITGSIIGSIERTGSIRYGAQLTRIGRRILPAAYTVLAISMVLSVLFLSQVYWEETFREIIAAALYIANWTFAASAVDYLAIDEFQSPVLQFWALSVQGQFYLVWPLVLLLAGLIARRRGASVRTTATAVIGVLVVVSFTYSVIRVGQNQVTAYYDSAARIWEFGLGGLTALLFASVVVPVWAARMMSLLGLAMIVGTGVLLDVSASFPGWPALIPTGGAVLILVAGTSSATVGGLRFLRWRPVAALGDISYAFFLWQWTLLSFITIGFDLERPTFIQGVGVMAAALLAAAVTHRLVERPFLVRRDAGTTRPSAVEAIGAVAVVGTLIVTAAVLVPSDDRVELTDVVASGVLPDVLSDERDPAAAAGDAVPPGGDAVRPEHRSPDPAPDPAGPIADPADRLADHDDRVVVAEDLFIVGDGPLVPDPATARRDRPIVYEEGCHQRPDRDDVIVCRYGEPGGRPIAVVGGSHAAQWQPAFDLLGQRHGWEIWMITKSACRFGRSPELSDSCNAWIDAAQTLLLTERPETVVLLGTTGSSPGERVVEGLRPLVRELADAGLRVVALRDNPWQSTNPPECVLEHGADAERCARPRTDALAAVNPLLEDPIVEHISLVVDLTPWLCTDERCPVVAGDVLMYRDPHHLTTVYVLALAPALEAILVPALGETP